jgi:hypothetical protein
MCFPALLAIPAFIGSSFASAGAALAGIGTASAAGVGATAGLGGAAAAAAGSTAAASGFSLASIFTPGVLSGLTIGLAGASAGLQFIGQSQAASAQSAMARAVAANAAGSYRAQTAFLDTQFLQQRAQLTQQSEAQNIQAEQVKARARTSAAEAGVAGVSLDAVLGDISRQQGRAADATAYNFDIAAFDNHNAKTNAYYGMVDRTNSVPMGVFPSLLSPLISTAGAALDAAGRYGYVDRLTRQPSA